MAKNEFQRLRNIAKAKKIKVPSMGLPPTNKLSSTQVKFILTNVGSNNVLDTNKLFKCNKKKLVKFCCQYCQYFYCIIGKIPTKIKQRKTIIKTQYTPAEEKKTTFTCKYYNE